MTSSLSDVPSGELIATLGEVENAIHNTTLPTRDNHLCSATAADDLAALVVQEQLLADELEVRRSRMRRGMAWCRQLKEPTASTPLNYLNGWLASAR